MSATDQFCVPVRLKETRGTVRSSAAVRLGVPLGSGLVMDPDALEAVDGQGASLPFQGRVLARWPDGSIKWLLAEVLCPVAAGATGRFHIGPIRQGGNRLQSPHSALQVRELTDVIEVDTGAARFQVSRRGTRLLNGVEINQQQLLEQGIVCNLTDLCGRLHVATLEEAAIEESGPVSATLRLSGRFAGAGRHLPLRFVARLRCVAGHAGLQLDLKIWNPRPALHAGGLWDLGDPGSCFFRDLSVGCRIAGGAGKLHWFAEHPAERRDASGTWTLYQDSSGGQRWDSPNHVDRHGRRTTSFRGYRVWQQDDGGALHEVAHGHRAAPGVCLPGRHGCVAVAVRDFWQCFPKALRREGDRLEIGVFPRESAAGFELQGGEQKRHTIYLDFGSASDQGLMDRLQHPVEAAVDPDWIARTGAIAWFATPAADDDVRYQDYVTQIIEGERSFNERREIIDEYGWRNFGDLYADHEAVNHPGTEPFVSHYNNQYDFIHGAFLQWQRTGDGRWRRQMEEAARHSIDIDIYRTQGDRPAFNGGLFWHTDHHKPAATSTHRTYSRANAGNDAYGGGPAVEHDYSSGFLHYYFSTGDEEAADTVRMLADWVIAMDDGERTPLAWLDAGPTGLASCTVEPDFHKPGRGAGNSVNTLLDAFSLAGQRTYLDKAAVLIRRCIHPRDDVLELRLDEPEFRWSYLVFLQALGKFLLVKRGLKEFDVDFHYARDSLLHYAAWMLANEVPYKDVLHKVLLPTETWSAHDIRKCHVLHLAAEYSSDAIREQFAARAAFFYRRCLEDLLAFPTSWLTRPLVILTVYGAVHDHFRRQGYSRPCWSEPHGHDFGAPVLFVGQRQRLASRPLGRVLLIAAALPKLLRERWTLLRHRLWSARMQHP